MTGWWIAVLLAVSALLLLPPSGTPAARSPARSGTEPGQHRQPVRRNPYPSRFTRFHRVRPQPELQDLPLLLHQLTGLLAAGRAPHQLWSDAAALQSGSNGAGPNGPLAERLRPVLEAAARAASLGLSPVPVFRAAAQTKVQTDGRALSPVRHAFPGRGTGEGTDHLSLESMWSELAACVAVSEHSGAPLAGVLGRYAAQLEAGLDQRAARETAMAGPQATVRLLTWLPAGGLGLGYLLGADPVTVLVGSPLGWLAAAAGVGLSLVGRFWSRALVRQAAGP